MHNPSVRLVCLRYTALTESDLDPFAIHTHHHCLRLGIDEWERAQMPAEDTIRSVRLTCALQSAPLSSLGIARVAGVLPKQLLVSIFA